MLHGKFYKEERLVVHHGSQTLQVIGVFNNVCRISSLMLDPLEYVSKAKLDEPQDLHGVVSLQDNGVPFCCAVASQ